MVRPKSSELTSRELAVMQVFWKEDTATADQIRESLAKSGEQLAYPTVANVVRGLADKGFLKQINDERPFRYRSVRSFEGVSKRLVGDMLTRLFAGSRETMLVQLLGRRKLSASEKAFLTDLLNEQEEN